MSQFSVFVPINSTVKLANGNTGHAQGIEIILCRFPKCLIIYSVGPVYYCPGHPFNTISSGDLKFYIGFKKVTSETLEHCDFVEPKGCYWRSLYQTRNNPEYLQLENFKINPHRYKNIVVSTVCGISKQTLSQLIHQHFGHVPIIRQNEWQQQDSWKVSQKISLNWKRPALSVS